MRCFYINKSSSERTGIKAHKLFKSAPTKKTLECVNLNINYSIKYISGL